MLLYRLRERRFLVPEGQSLRFPNKVTIEVHLQPPVPFGGVAGASRNVVVDEKLKANFNLTTGRVSVRRAEPLFDKLQAEMQHRNAHFQVEGNIVRVSSLCTSRQDLQDFLSAVYYAFPAVLNVYFPDTPMAVMARGVVGKTSFRWAYEPSEIIASTVVTSKENQEQLVTDSWAMVPLVGTGANQRLMAGLHYFHVACRLLAAGSNRFEFMAEALLNFAKCLQALFGESRDEVRTELGRLGKFTPEEIEARFIPAMLLRNEFDVAHVHLALLSREELRVLHLYTNVAETAFRELLKSVLDGIKAGTYKLPTQQRTRLSSEKRRTLRVLRGNLKKTGLDI